MKKTNILLIGVIYILISCNTKDTNFEDPLMDFEINESRASWNNKLNNHLGKEISIIDDDWSNGYKYYFKKGNDSVFSTLEFNIDDYNFGNLRSMKFNIMTDPTFSNTPYTVGFVDTSTVNKMKKWLIGFYGTPDDTLGSFMKRKSSKNHKIILGPWNEFYYLGHVNGYKWETDKYDVVFDSGEIPESSSFKDKKDGTHVMYILKDYYKEIKKISDSIRLTLKPNDLVIFDTPYKPVLKELKYDNYNYKLSFNTAGVSRKGREEKRKIKSLLTDFVVTDEFENEVLRLRDYRFDLSDDPIKLTGWNKERRYNITSRFNITNTPEGRKYRKFVRLYEKDKNKLNIHADIKAVVFDDGDVLKE